MKRIGGLKLQAAAGVPKRPSMAAPLSNSSPSAAWVREYEAQRVESSACCSSCSRRDIRIARLVRPSSEQQAAVRKYYLRSIFPLVTPLALDPAHPFPFVSNLSLNLLVTGQSRDPSSQSSRG